jgi:hypothetical protein
MRGAVDSTAWLQALQLRLLAKKLEGLAARPGRGQRQVDRDLLEAVKLKLDLGTHVDRLEAAAYLGVSTRKLQRMEDAGQLKRCPGMGAVVRYAARDVLRLASASSRKGA